MRLRLTPTHFALYRAYLEGVDDAILHRTPMGRPAPAWSPPGS